MMRLVAAAAMVALSSYQAELVRADDTLNGHVTQAFGKSEKFRLKPTQSMDCLPPFLHSLTLY